MNIIKEADFKAKLKSGLSGGYFFFGEEDYLKRHYVSAARDAVSGEDSFAAFNDIKLDGEDFSADKLAELLMVPPMMSDKKFIELRGFDLTSMKQSEFDALCESLELLSEYDFNVLIFSVDSDSFEAGYLPKNPSSQLTRLSELLTPVQFELMPPRKLSAWVKRHFTHEDLKIEDVVCDYFVDYCGRNMFILKNEIEKLSAYVKYEGRDTVSREDIKEVSVQGTEFGVFAFSNSIMQKDTKLALSMLSLYKLQKKEPVMIMAEVTKTFSEMLSVKLLYDSGMTSFEIAEMLKGQKIKEYKVGLYIKSVSKTPIEKLQKIISLCRDTDLKLKNSPSGYIAIERLICSI